MNPHENIRRTRLITETAVSVALATFLGFIRLYRLPWGGALSLKLLPLIYLAFKHGPKAGMAGGLLTGLITLILDPVILHPIQVLLDYGFPYIALGILGWFPAWPRLGIAVTSVIRLLSHVLSGVIYFSAYAPPQMNDQVYHFYSDSFGLTFPFLLNDWTAPWLYSILYNSSVIIPEALLMILIVPPILRRLKAMPI